MKTASFVLRKGAVPKKYDHISFVPPKGVRDEAKRGLKLRREHGRGGLSTKQASSHGIGSGVQRAATLASGGRVSPSTIKRMRSFFARHSAYKEHHKDRTSAAYISWLLWGGDAGERWANKVYAQMERADEEMKKAVAGGERAGHKYIRRIRTARNGRMGYRYIYKRPKIQSDGQVEQGGTEERTSSGYLTMDVLRDYGLADAVTSTSPTPLEDTRDAFAVQLADRSYALLNAEALFKELDNESAPEELVSLVITQELGDLATEWEPDDVAESIFDKEVDHSGTFEAMVDAPMGEQETLSFDDSTVVDDDVPALDAEEEGTEDAPDLDVAAEQHETLTETLRENPELEPLADAIDAIAPVKDGKINLPKKKVGKTIALLTLITAVETYKIATAENDNAPDLNDLESASRRGLKQIDKDKIAEAKAKMRESLNKERQEARDKMTREKLAARLKERQEKNKAAKEAQERELEFRKQEAELKEQRKQEAKDKQAARREEARDKQSERKKAEAEKRAEIKEAQKEKDAARKEAQKEKAAARKEAQKEKEAARKEAAQRKKATRKKAEEKRAQKRKRAADLRKKAEETRREKQKEKQAERKKAEKEKQAERKQAEKEKAAARKKAEAERKQAERERLKREEREHKEKLKREEREHKEKLKREEREHKEKLKREATEQRERIRASQAPKKVAKKQPKKASPSAPAPKTEDTKKEEPKNTSSTPKKGKKSSAKGKRRKKGRWRKSTFFLTRQRMTDEATP